MKFFDLKTILLKTFSNLDAKIIKIMKIGLKLACLILLISTIILTAYLFFIHNQVIYYIGLAFLQISLYIMADFIISGIAVDTISKQIQ